MITIEQIRAARAFLGWSQKELADHADLSQTGIARIENGLHQPTLTTMTKIMTAFEDAGIEFTQDGLLKRDDSVRVITGENCYMRLLEDVQKSFAERKKGHKELLIWCADDRASSPDVNDMYRQLRRTGVTMRQLVEDNNTYLMGGLEEYRYLPKDHFINVVKLNYADKYATVNSSETRIMIHKDKEAARSNRAVFDLLWKILPQPQRSEADERF